MPQARTPLRIGIAGLGRLGRRHAENLAHRTPGAVLVAACSPVEAEREHARATLGVETVYADYDALLAHPGLDAVVLVTPTSLHADQAIAALRADKHVFVEKPLALNVADCERVEAVAARHPSCVAMVGFVRRFDPSYANAFEAIRRGQLGRPFLVRSQTCDAHDPSGFFVRFAPTSGGIFMDCSVHDIDLARWMLGGARATRAFATGTIALHPDLAPLGDVDNGLAVVEFEGGARAVFYASRTFAHGHEPQTEVIGTRGKLIVGQGAWRDRVEFSDADGTHRHTVGDFFERFEQAFQLEMAAFAAACRGERPVPLTLADATEATRIGQAITASLRSGQPEPIATPVAGQRTPLAEPA
ncbi:Gfo/Idh/MocA family oxidoreductase [Ralstonia solanacearum]|uniref:Gfo/Idh/MocA family oxidoreductase n=1 Tax=Ralstonia solanacearum TaxID=305 RepID=UPI00078CDE43|nr:Gfo/Idh/MocA family oxidoreductase [Ralstonia solanacearum]AMP37922.1 oxidoreductase [Ralstonia solanacearum]AXV86748.1 oxidoreductase [Ralstonia solanacearum]AXW06245.1 oxidoreductase [Ralstonia solanacearum]AXW23988.1 oxidoreductase [Ralstonia solanacearum]AXW80921.1 oxidoreductase [Ralstonia solanacearum]